ncbi:MAG TPA: glycosyltransferase family 2 protein [Nitrospirota bacterium]|nr:glycosyltransferase family 2 protein [Nitrospirota bacterium]
MEQKLSIAIITYNEESNIRRTLESVAWALEIIIVDSGSSDKTVQICREYTDKIFHQDWLGFACQKNLAIDKTSGDWVLSLDADEPIEPELVDEIKEIISSSTSHDGYRIPRRTFFLGKEIKHGGWYPDYNLRLFRRGKGRFEERAVHEAIRVKGSVGKTRHAILHFAYPDLISYLSMMNKYTTLAVEVMSTQSISAFKIGWMNILFRPVLTFLYKFIFRLGFLDGKHGLVLNLFHAGYVFAKYAKAWERRESKEYSKEKI